MLLRPSFARRIPATPSPLPRVPPGGAPIARLRLPYRGRVPLRSPHLFPWRPRPWLSAGTRRAPRKEAVSYTHLTLPTILLV
eukprot:1403774-Pleurochrysis_carterae.AAC.1